MYHAARDHEHMKRHMEPRVFSAYGAEYRAEEVDRAAEHQKQERTDIYLVYNRKRAGEHHRAGDYIHSDARGFRLLEKEQLGDKAEQHASPAEQEHYGTADFVVIIERYERARGRRAREQHGDNQMIDKTRRPLRLAPRQTVVDRRRAVEQNNRKSVDDGRCRISRTAQWGGELRKHFSKERCSQTAMPFFAVFELYFGLFLSPVQNQMHR